MEFRVALSVKALDWYEQRHNAKVLLAESVLYSVVAAVHHLLAHEVEIRMPYGCPNLVHLCYLGYCYHVSVNILERIGIVILVVVIDIAVLQRRDIGLISLAVLVVHPLAHIVPVEFVESWRIERELSDSHIVKAFVVLDLVRSVELFCPVAHDELDRLDRGTSLDYGGVNACD